MDAELAACMEELESAMRLGMGAVLSLAEDIRERAFSSRDLLHRAALLQGAGECYLAVGRNIPTPGNELALLVLEQAESCFMGAALLYEACGRADAAAEVYDRVLTCLQSRKCRMINLRNFEAVCSFFSHLIELCRSRIKMLRDTESFLYVNI